MPCDAQVVSSADVVPSSSDDSRKLWQALIVQASTRGLPVRFVEAIDPGFVTLEFDDLHAYAAEYHPNEHRMVLNLALSFNSAGGVLKPLASLTTRELGTLYHELFHAYMDYISSISTSLGPGSPDTRLFAFAKSQQGCRYQQVNITPIPQRKTRTETRSLTERESWEALNETWGVFVGWAIWTRLEVHGRGPVPKRGKSPAAEQEAWLKRLKKADRDGDIIGYYEPEDEAERAVARKRYLAPSHRISPPEASMVLETVLEYSAEETRRSAAVMEKSPFPFAGGTDCPH
jgi:hypothetical protein